MASSRWTGCPSGWWATHAASQATGTCSALDKERFARVDIWVHMKGGGHVAQMYAVCLESPGALWPEIRGWGFQAEQRHPYPGWPDPAGSWSPSLQIPKSLEVLVPVLATRNPTHQPIMRIRVHLYNKRWSWRKKIKNVVMEKDVFRTPRQPLHRRKNGFVAFFLGWSACYFSAVLDENSIWLVLWGLRDRWWPMG